MPMDEPVCLMYRESSVHEFYEPTALYPHMMLATDVMPLIKPHLPVKTKVTESNRSMAEIVRQHETEKRQMIVAFEDKLREKDLVYMATFYEIKETLRAHSLAISEIKETVTHL